MTVSIEELEKRYQLFNAGDLDALVEHFNPDGVVNQLESGKSFTGHDEIRELMQGWPIFFEGAHIVDIRIQPADDRLSEVPGTTQCFQVDFTGTGRYVNTMPGLEDVAPAHGNEVRLPLRETDWLDQDGKFVRVDNSIQIAALQ